MHWQQSLFSYGNRSGAAADLIRYTITILTTDGDNHDRE
jgi:hypothetical protein